MQQDSVFDHVASANVQSRHSSSPNSKSPGLQELPRVENAGGQLRREAMYTCPTQGQVGPAEGLQVGERLQQEQQAGRELGGVKELAWSCLMCG